MMGERWRQGKGVLILLFFSMVIWFFYAVGSKTLSPPVPTSDKERFIQFVHSLGETHRKSDRAFSLLQSLTAESLQNAEGGARETLLLLGRAFEDVRELEVPSLQDDTATKDLIELKALYLRFLGGRVEAGELLSDPSRQPHFEEKVSEIDGLRFPTKAFSLELSAASKVGFSPAELEAFFRLR